MVEVLVIMLTTDDFIKMIDKLPKAEFVNEHGERFVIHSTGSAVYMSGDEVNMMVDDKNKIVKKYIPLFSPHFSIWSKDELYKLGEALMELHK